MEVAGSTPAAGDRGMSTDDVANALIQRRQAQPEQPAPNTEDEDLSPEALKREALGEQDLEDDQGDDIEGDGPEIEAAGEDQDLDDPTDADEDAGDDEEGFRFESIEEVAEAAGMELDDFLKLSMSTLVDGEEGTVTLEQLRKGHQLESSFTRKNQEWIQQKQKAEAEIQAQREKLNDHFQLTTEVFQHAQQALVADFESINWHKLQAENPQQYQQLRQQFGMRQGRLNQAIQEAKTRLAKAAEQQEAEEAQAEQAALYREHEALMGKVPEWTDPKTRDADAAEIGKYLTSIGYTPAELEKMTDHRLILLARAALGQSGPTKRQVELAKKKLKSVPKVAKPGARNKSRDSGKGKITGLKNTLKKTGKTDDAAELLLARRQSRARNRRRKASPA